MRSYSRNHSLLNLGPVGLTAASATLSIVLHSEKNFFLFILFLHEWVCLWSFLSYYHPLTFQEGSPESVAILSACFGPCPSAPHAWDCLSLFPLLPCPGCCLSNLLLSVFSSSGIFLSVRAVVRVSQEHPLS